MGAIAQGGVVGNRAGGSVGKFATANPFGTCLPYGFLAARAAISAASKARWAKARAAGKTKL